MPGCGVALAHSIKRSPHQAMVVITPLTASLSSLPPRSTRDAIVMLSANGAQAHDEWTRSEKR